MVLELPSEKLFERKFDVYYLQKEGIFHRYILALNGEILIISVMRTNKSLQKLMGDLDA